MTLHPNPCRLALGGKILVKRTCKVERVGSARKLVFTYHTPFTAVVIGSAKKALGTYADFNPCFGSLQVSKYVRLYECRVKMSGSVFFVHPNDIEAEEE